MIVFTLQCSNDHAFEAWFRDGATYAAQAAAGEVSCPLCADTDISKAPMAPRINKGGMADPGEAKDANGPEQLAAPEEQPAQARVPAPGEKAMMDPRMRELAKLRAAMLSLKKMVQDNCDYVGSEFADEARRIHHGEAEERAIYGEATEEEAEELADEGVPVGRIPWPTESDA